MNKNLARIALALLFLILFWNPGNGQLLFPEVYSSFGGYTEHSSVVLTWTAGEPFFETIRAEHSAILTQGFNQAVVVAEEITVIDEESFSVSIYPNPASSYIVIHSREDLMQNTEVRLVSVHGTIAFLGLIENNPEIIDASTIPAGIYFLQFTDTQLKTRKTFRIAIIK